MAFQPNKAGSAPGTNAGGLGFIPASKPWNDDGLLVEADVIDETNNSTARPDSVKLPKAIAEAYRKCRGRWALGALLILDLCRSKNGRE
jgi:hypothetical protein